MKKIILVICLLVVPVLLCSCMAPFYAMRQAAENARFQPEYSGSSYNGYFDADYYDDTYASYDDGYNDGYNDGYDDGYSDGYGSYDPDSIGNGSNAASPRSVTCTMPTVPVTFSVPDNLAVFYDEAYQTESGWQGDSYAMTDPDTGAVFSFTTNKTSRTEAIGDFDTAGGQKVWEFITQDIQDMQSIVEDNCVISDYGIAKMQDTTYGYLHFTCDDPDLGQLYVDQYYTVKNGVWAVFELYTFDEEPSPALEQVLRGIIESAYYL